MLLKLCSSICLVHGCYVLWKQNYGQKIPPKYEYVYISHRHMCSEGMKEIKNSNFLLKMYVCASLADDDEASPQKQTHQY
jgi:hypothetical protein